MSFLTETVPKIFLIIFGVIVIVVLVMVVNNIGTTTCGGCGLWRRIA